MADVPRYRVPCGECGADMVLRTSAKHTYRDGRPHKFWGCSRWPHCNGTHGAHPDGSPLGVPGDRETKALRIEAHRLFDQLWRKGGAKREAYRWLQKTMNLSVKEGHIGKLSADQCRALIAKLEKKLARQTRGV